MNAPAIVSVNAQEAVNVHRPGTIFSVERLFARRWLEAAAMGNESKRQEPEIMPPVPEVEPKRSIPEIPPDKDAPEKQSPVKGGV